MIGASLRRREDARVLRGKTRYLDDINQPGMAHAAFVRSPYAHASIESISVPPSAEGLIAVITATELRDAVRPFPVMQPRGAEVRMSEAHPVLASGEVRYVGQPAALVIAHTRALAEDAAELVEVEYEPRPVVTSPRASNLTLMRWHRRTGDVDAAFAAAAHVATGSYALPRLVAAPMEARGCIASHDPADGLLTVWCSAQDTHRPLEHLAHILGRPESAIRVIVPDVGGAFGSKGVIAPEVAAVAAAALRLGIPIKWAEDRLENMLAASQGRGIEGDLELALDAEGRMLALRAQLWSDSGGYLLTTTTLPPHTAATLIAGCYDIAVADVTVVGAQTHKVPIGPYRGAGRPDAAYMLEALVDEAARQMGIDRVTLRRRNLIRVFPHTTPTGLEYDSGDFERCLDLALELSGAHPDPDPEPEPEPEPDPEPEPRSVRAEAARPEAVCVRGTGIAVYVERAGGAFESAAIQLQPGGRFTIASSSSPHGQGHDITFAQIAADRLHVPVHAIELRFGDSATTPPGVGTFGSRSVAMAGSAVALASDELLERARALAAEVGLEAPPSLDWTALAQAADTPLRAEASFRSPNVFSSGAYVASVRIDRATGVLTVEQLAAVDDAGTLINPLLVHGQVLGGAVQGLGECLCEEAVYDEDGQPRSGSLLEYALLTAADIPPIVTGEVQTPSPLNPLGAKGAGEGGAVGALAAVANAVTDALDGRYVSPPFTAEKLWRALADGGSRRQ
ncbi:MAG TPA: xanthine dehydrogenase family protein molybdopterin-binding subunit [Solirubrobacteraceae bacterium]|nr:xanthine dehydrogenase family protein molybdopterin-binding subunit [Solirubrobacteraceae bacterium]